MQETNSKSKRLAKDTILFGISSFGSKIILFLLVPLYTSILTTENYGIADLITTTVELIYPVLTLGISDATLRFALSKDENKKNVLAISLIFIFFSNVILLSCYPLISFLSPKLNEYWLYFILIFFLFNLHNCFSNFMKGINKVKIYAIQGIIQTLAIVTCNILLLVVFKLGLKGYLISIIVGYSIPIIFMFFFGCIFKYISFLNLRKKLFLEMLKYSIPMIPTILSWAIITSLDKYMIIYTNGIGESGIYSVAHKIPTILTAIISIFIQAWQISAITNYGDSDESEYYTKIYRKFDLINTLFAFGLIIFSRILAKILFDEAYFSACIFVPFLLISSVFSNNASFLASAYRASKKTILLFVSVFVGAVVNVCFNILFIWLFGTKGAAVATALSFFIVWLIRMIFIQKIVRVKINIILTILNYVLLICSALLFTFEWQYFYIVSIACLFGLIVLNFKDLIDMIKKCIGFINNKIVHKTN